MKMSATFLLAAMLPACSAGVFPSNLGAFSTPTPSNTPLPTSTITLTGTSTATLAPTKTLTPAITRTPTITLTASITPTRTITVTPLSVHLGSRLESSFGYSFRYPPDYVINPFEELYGMYWAYDFDHELNATLLLESQEYPSEMSVGQVLDKASRDKAYKTVFEDAVPLTIGGVAGISVAWPPDTARSQPGVRIAVIPQGGNRFFMKLSIECSRPFFRGSEASAVFLAVADSIIFFKPEITPCEWAQDETYGLPSENPIRIAGGGAGWDRIDAYFYGVSGPGGLETVRYEWMYSLSRSGTSLDVYLAYYATEIGGFGPETTLYFERHSFERPMAPDGFVCMGAHFSFGEP